MSSCRSPAGTCAMSDRLPHAPASGRALVRRSPLVQLTLVRVREFTREPEAVFWALFFPILITAGLGIAFRSRPAEVLKIAVVGPELAAGAPPGARRSTSTEADVAAAEQLLRTGKVALVVEPAPGRRRRLPLRRHESRGPHGADARRRRHPAGRRARRSGARRDDSVVREPGSRYIDFLVPGLVGLGIMSNALWGLGFSIVDARRRKLTKRLIATPMSRASYLLSYPGLADDGARGRGRRAGRLRRRSPSACRCAAG